MHVEFNAAAYFPMNDHAAGRGIWVYAASFRVSNGEGIKMSVRISAAFQCRSRT